MGNRRSSHLFERASIKDQQEGLTFRDVQHHRKDDALVFGLCIRSGDEYRFTGITIRWRGSVLLRRRKEREGKDRPPAPTRLRESAGFSDLHEQLSGHRRCDRAHSPTQFPSSS
jgi:hypothetical protein